MDAITPSPEIAQRCCPTCGHELLDQFAWDLDERTFVAGGVAVRFTKFQAKLFDAIWRMRFKGGIRDREHFMSLVYGDDPDGGSEAFTVISVHVAHVREKLIPTGHTLTLNFGSPRRGWRLVKIT
jgi:DNA-binding response OmpR family regulator